MGHTSKLMAILASLIWLPRANKCFNWVAAAPLLIKVAGCASTGHDELVAFVNGPRPSPNYSESVRLGNIVAMSGQIGTSAAGDMPSDFAEQARNTMENLAGALARQGMTTDNVFKCTVLIIEMDNWSDFNEVYVKYFDEDRLPVRTAYGVSALPLGAQIEIDCWAAR